MLTELHIENIAVISKASIPFKHGFNVFTGETGAGKTILISAIGAVLGERTSRDIIRSGEEKAQVSALFEDISLKTKKILEDMGFETPDNSILIFREMTASGRNNCRVNGLPANVSILKEISQHLIHIHGQRDTSQLISPEAHLEMVDDFGELQEDIKEYQEVYKGFLRTKTELASLHMDESVKAQRLDMLSFQIEEIEKANLSDPKEEENLLAEKKMVTGGEKIRRGLSAAIDAYHGGGESSGIEDLLGVFSDGLNQASVYMKDVEELIDRLEDVLIELVDIAGETQHTLEELDFDPQELDRIERRLDEFYHLKRKYGNSLEEIMEFHTDALEEYQSINLSEVKKEKLTKDLQMLEKQAMELAHSLSRKRAHSCKKFLGGVESELLFLDMPNVKLSVAHEKTELGMLGSDQLEFMITANLGEAPKALGRIASGGELARIMLAIKNVMADRDDIDTLVFDEIDTGVSGVAAGKIGRKLSEVSEKRQVICVTHLAQVAAFANNHLYIHKTVENNRTFTKIDVLGEQDSVEELARIASGEIITPAALESARELIQRAGSPYIEPQKPKA